MPGTITQVELNPINDGVQSSTAGGTTAPMYRASVARSTHSLTMYGKRHAFEPGLTLEADIFNDRRRPIAWVFDDARIAELERENDILRDRFIVWQYNASMRMSHDELERPLPEVDRRVSKPEKRADGTRKS